MRTRSYTVDDYPRVIAFLRQLYQLSPDTPYWLPARWEYAAHLVSPLYRHRGFPDWKQSIRIWEDEQGDVVAVVNSENPDEQAFLHVHPSHRNLESELLAWAETNIGTIKAGRDWVELAVWAIDGDIMREQLLTDRGYIRQDLREHLLLRDLEQSPPIIPLPKDYSVHTMLESVDLEEKISCMTSAFQSEPYPRQIYETMQRAPSYRPELDLFTRDADGAISSFCIIWVDDGLDIAYFEPVGTHPDHQRRGLGRTTLNEGLRRLRDIGTKKAYVGASGDWRGTFYKSAGFDSAVAFRPWRKCL